MGRFGVYATLRSKPDLTYILEKGYEPITVPLEAILGGSQSILRRAWSCLNRLPADLELMDGISEYGLV